jgi:hypothetical protein
MQRFEKWNYPTFLMSDEDVIIAGAAFVHMKMLCQTRKKQKRRWWQREMFKRRYNESDLLTDLRLEDRDFQVITRMSVTFKNWQ